MKQTLLNHRITFLLIFISAHVLAQDKIAGTEVSLQSPDHKLTFHFYQKSWGDKKKIYYKLDYSGMTVLAESELNIQMDNQLSEKAMALKIDEHQEWCENLKVTGLRQSEHDSTWAPICGENKLIRDHYNAITISFVKSDNPIYKMDIEVRMYDEGLALRYFLPENAKGSYYNIIAEHTTFTLPEGTRAWFANWAQAPYYNLPLKDWPGDSERPLTLQLANGLSVSLCEAQLTDYARTKFMLSKKPNTIETSMSGNSQLISPVATPWRVILVAEKPAVLIEHNYILLNLNEPSRIRDTSWIKPGKIMRVMSQTTADARRNIDFAVQHHLQYILFDWKWYGPAFSFNSDATKVAIPNFDLPGIIRYGNENGIGVWLYVNQQALLAQSDTLFKAYHRWGIKGVKFGFVQVGSHRWTTWIEKTIQQAAAARIMVNIHDDWRPTGEQRTWPNLMTAEGIRGNEEMPDATHNTILPFTRFIAGPADYTICYLDKRIKTTHAHQLALGVIYYSPIQTLYWYDKPESFENEPELDFWDKLSTTWDQTQILEGEPGKYITTARRKGEAWYLGTITNNNARTFNLPLRFLSPGRDYLAVIYADDSKTSTRAHVRISQIRANSKTVLKMNLAPSGGEAIYLKPIN